MKHTPGPWALRKEWKSDDTALEVWPKSKEVEKPFIPSAIARVCDNYDEFKANAKLIASAPDMAIEIESLKEQKRELLEALSYSVSEIDAFYQAAKEGRIKTVVTLGQFRRLTTAKNLIAKLTDKDQL